MINTDKLREKILDKVSEKELDAFIASLADKNAIFASNELLALKYAANHFGVKHTVTTNVTMSEDSGIMKVAGVNSTTLENASFNAWIIYVGELREGSKNGRDWRKASIDLADETGIVTGVSLFNENADEFMASGLKVGDAVSIRNAFVKDNTYNGRVYRNVTIGKYAEWGRYDPDKDGELCDLKDIKARRVANLQSSQASIISGMFVEDIQWRKRVGCPVCFKSMSVPVGSSILCTSAKCGTKRTAVNLVSGRSVFGDASGNVELQFPPWYDGLREVKAFQETILYVYNYDPKRGEATVRSMLPFKVDTSVSKVNPADLTPLDVWRLVEQLSGDDGVGLSYLIEQTDYTAEDYQPKLELLIERGVVREASPGRYITDFTDPTEVSALLDEENADGKEEEKPTVVLQYGSEEEKSSDPSPEAITEAVDEFKLIKPMLNVFTPSDLRELLKKRSGAITYKMRPIVERLVADGEIKIEDGKLVVIK